METDLHVGKDFELFTELSDRELGPRVGVLTKGSNEDYGGSMSFSIPQKIIVVKRSLNLYHN